MDRPSAVAKCDVQSGTSVKEEEVREIVLMQMVRRSENCVRQLLFENIGSSKWESLKITHEVLKEMLQNCPNRRYIEKQPIIQRNSLRPRFNHHRGDRLNNKSRYCQFCMKNGETESVYGAHDNKTCPILASFQCTICKEFGHTVKYCLLNNSSQSQLPIMRMLTNGCVCYNHSHK